MPGGTKPAIPGKRQGWGQSPRLGVHGHNSGAGLATTLVGVSKGTCSRSSKVSEGRCPTKGRAPASSPACGCRFGSSGRGGPRCSAHRYPLSSRTLTSWSRSECPGLRSCSSPRSCRSARPRPCHSRPRSPRPPSLRTARGAGPAGQCGAVRRESTGASTCCPHQCPRHSPAPAQALPTEGQGHGMVAREMSPSNQLYWVNSVHPHLRPSQKLRTWPYLGLGVLQRQ